ncbi:MAG: hypothetical protein M5U28_22930 [Sandaracinaceae bacterium]|nr:hypothetical protein [Sandaracinaceae bacterium]
MNEVMRRTVATVPPELPVSELVSDYVMGTDQQCFPVVREGHLEGWCASPTCARRRARPGPGRASAR